MKANNPIETTAGAPHAPPAQIGNGKETEEGGIQGQGRDAREKETEDPDHMKGHGGKGGGTLIIKCLLIKGLSTACF